MSDQNRADKKWRTVREDKHRAHVKWLWDSFHHHARLYRERLNNLRFPEEVVRRSYDDASEFLLQLREVEPLTRLLYWPPFEDVSEPSVSPVAERRSASPDAGFRHSPVSGFPEQGVD